MHPLAVQTPCASNQLSGLARSHGDVSTRARPHAKAIRTRSSGETPHPFGTLVSHARCYQGPSMMWEDGTISLMVKSTSRTRTLPHCSARRIPLVDLPLPPSHPPISISESANEIHRLSLPSSLSDSSDNLQWFPASRRICNIRQALQPTVHHTEVPSYAHEGRIFSCRTPTGPVPSLSPPQLSHPFPRS